MSRIKITRPTEAELKELGAGQWSEWSCDVSRFPWEYGAEETCYIHQGRVIVETEGGESVEIKKGDLVTFPSGMKCAWDVKEKISKVYTFK
ncbi:MAG: cupin domain-containing protein [Thermoleophilia bacterium]|nr:cupin domain-containing protein [Thermoleophilia bacterium]